MHFYLFFKWLHIVSVISWMAGILYLLRLFIYHRENGEKNVSMHELFGIMETRLYRIITFPAMISAWVGGLGMIYLQPYLLKQGWLHAKLALVLILTGTTLYANRMRKNFTHSLSDQISSRKLRMLNEVPAILMLAIVALVVFKCS